MHVTQDKLWHTELVQKKFSDENVEDIIKNCDQRGERMGGEEGAETPVRKLKTKTKSKNCD